MVFQIIRKTIEYIPNLSDPLDGLLERFQKKYINTCSKEYGFVLQVIRIVQTLSSKISIYNAHIIVECDIEIECLIPKVGEIVYGNVQQLFPQGVILIVQNCMKTFIPSPKKQYIKNQQVTFRIEQTRFQKGKYDCIGSEILE